MPKQIIIAEQHRIAAVFSEDQIQELVVATGNHQVGDIYLGIVENVLPGIDAAFVNIGDADRNGFIHVSDLGPLRLKRTAGAITELLAPQQKVLVQVMKEPTGSKGPRLTGNITLPGRYLVLMPYGRGVNLSRRIKSENERNRLRALAILIKPEGMGLLVRTEAEGRDEEAIIEDLEALLRQYRAIGQEAQSVRAPALLNRDDDFIQRVLRDMYSGDVNRIVVDSSTAVKRVKQQLLTWGGGKSPQGVLIDHHRLGASASEAIVGKSDLTAPKDSRYSILEYFRVNAAIREALKPRVELPSGGYIIIEPTEALTVIDVNSGSFTRSATARETVLWTNCEAATEIARQLRLRNLAGVIIVDFIDMDSQRDQLQVLEHFNKALKADKARPQIAQLSELGLVELTRKRQGQNIYELFGRPCTTCGGLGHLVHLPGDPSYPQREERERERVSNAPSVETPALRYGRGDALRDVLTPELGEIPERSRISFRDYRPSEPDKAPGQGTAYGSGERVREGRNLETADFDFGSDSDLEEGDLGFSSNDRNRVEENNSRRRRRRRIGGDEGSFRDEETRERNTSIPSPIPANSDVYARSELPATNEGFSPTPVKVNRIEISERHRPIKPETAPPEVISVEMTPEEQDVYAFMGVSPLVRLKGEVKNPKSAIVAVRSPGQVADELEESDRIAKINPASFVPVPANIEPPSSFEENPEVAPKTSDEIQPSTPSDSVAISSTAEEENGELLRRRRRRRSSANEGE